MRITPLDVRKQEFRRGMRGLDPEEVYAFLATVADEYETVLTDNRQLRDRVLELDEKVTEYRNMEKTLRDTLLTAERVMNEARENARKESELILRDAKVQAQQASQISARQAETLRAQLRELRSLRDRYLARLKGLAEAQIGMVENFLQDFEEDDRDARQVEASGSFAPQSSRGQAVHPSSALPDPYPAAGREEALGSSSQDSFAASTQDTSAVMPTSAMSPPSATATDGMNPPTAEGGWNEATEAPSATATDEMNPQAAEDGWNEASEDSPQEPADDHWRDYQPGVSPEAPPVEAVAATVAEMAQAAGAESGQGEETMPPSADSGDELPFSSDAGQPEEEPAVVASAEETGESSKGSRWSISRFTRGLGDF